MVSNKSRLKDLFKHYVSTKGYRSFGPIRGLIYGGGDYGDHANNEIKKFAMIKKKH